MLDETFGAAYIDNETKHRILGVSLRPFCLWHLLLLQVIDSPFVNKGDVTKRDLKTAIGICCLGYRQSKVHRPMRIIWGQKHFEKLVKRFLDYVGDYLNKPEYNVIQFDSGPGSRPPRHVNHPPEAVMVAYDAAHGARVSIKEAWEMPIGEAYVSQAMYLRQQGLQLDFMDLEERMFQRELMEAGIK